MKYSHMLLITLVISLVWGLILFILGLIWRFNQAMLVNNYIQGLTEKINPKACVPPNTQIDMCPYETEFDDVQMGDWANNLGNIGIITGFIVILLSLCGAVGVVKKSQALLIVMFMLIVTGIGLQYYLLDIVLNGHGSFHDSAREELVDKLESEYEVEVANPFTKMLNAVMIMGGCCGVIGPEDFNVNYTFTYDQKIRNIVTPPACCPVEQLSGTDAQAVFTNVMECSSDNWSAKSAQDGCYNSIHKGLYASYGGALVGFLMFLILWEGVQGILLFMILLRPAPKTPRKSRASTRSSDNRSAARTKNEVQKKKFIPFSKISSYVSSDVNRIKSTEIW